MRLALGFNIINMLPDLLINTTLIWEPAALFYDLLIAVFKSLVPLVVFIIYIGFTFVFLLPSLPLISKPKTLLYAGLARTRYSLTTSRIRIWMP